MPDLISVNNVDLPILTYKTQRVITLEMMDQVHARPSGTARRTFNYHKNHLVEGEDYFRRNVSEAQEFGITAPNGLTLLTQSGYLMLVKSFRDTLAWTVQRRLVTTYFVHERDEAPTLPALHDPKLRMMVEAIVRMDAVEQQMAQQQHQLVAQQQEMLKTQDLALAALRGQMWMTIRQYVYLHDLARQLPPSQQRTYATWLGGYCLEKGIPMYKAVTADVAWPDERTYHIGAIHDTLDPWLARHHGQAPLAILPSIHAKE